METIQEGYGAENRWVDGCTEAKSKVLAPGRTALGLVAFDLSENHVERPAVANRAELLLANVQFWVHFRPGAVSCCQRCFLCFEGGPNPPHFFDLEAAARRHGHFRRDKRLSFLFADTICAIACEKPQG